MEGNKNIQPTVSVVMPVFNMEKYLHEALESILNQTFSNFELIVINDGSTDSTLEIINKYAQKDQRVVIVNHESNHGLISSLNEALKMARGRYIARMDGDDISVPGRFEYQVKYLDENKDIFLVAGSFSRVYEDGRVIKGNSKEYTPEEVKENFFKPGFILHPSVMFRNEENIFYREKARYCEDLDLWSRFITEGKKLFVSSELLIYYRIHEKSVSSKNLKTQKNMVKEVLRWHKQRIESGKDSYDEFDLSSLEKKNEDPATVIKRREIKLLFLSDSEPGVVRSYIKEYWKKRGVFSWVTSLGIFLVCMIPGKLGFKIRNKITKYS